MGDEGRPLPPGGRAQGHREGRCHFGPPRRYEESSADGRSGGEPDQKKLRIFRRALAKAKQFRDNKVKEVTSMAEAKQQTENGVALVPWCGEEDCGHQLEDQVGG